MRLSGFFLAAENNRMVVQGVRSGRERHGICGFGGLAQSSAKTDRITSANLFCWIVSSNCLI